MWFQESSPFRIYQKGVPDPFADVMFVRLKLEDATFFMQFWGETAGEIWLELWQRNADHSVQLDVKPQDQFLIFWASNSMG